MEFSLGQWLDSDVSEPLLLKVYSWWKMGVLCWYCEIGRLVSWWVCILVAHGCALGIVFDILIWVFSNSYWLFLCEVEMCPCDCSRLGVVFDFLILLFFDSCWFVLNLYWISVSWVLASSFTFLMTCLCNRNSVLVVMNLVGVVVS